MVLTRRQQEVVVAMQRGERLYLLNHPVICNRIDGLPEEDEFDDPVWDDPRWDEPYFVLFDWAEGTPWHVNRRTVDVLFREGVVDIYGSADDPIHLTHRPFSDWIPVELTLPWRVSHMERGR